MSDLRLLLTLSNIEIIKDYLRNELPQVKSSHRVEAVSRGLGFHTYAAMRHAAKSGVNYSALPDGNAFAGYLAGHGFKVETVYLYRAIASAAVIAVMKDVPRLSIWGYGIRPQYLASESHRESTQEAYERFLKERAEFLELGCLDAFLLAFAFVRKIPTTKTNRTGAGSYKLKHIAENMHFICRDGTKLGPHYVPNGALIAAAVYAGFKMKTYVDHLGYEEINVTFNMSTRAIDDFDCEIRSDGPIAARRKYLKDQKRSRWLYASRPYSEPVHNSAK